MAFGTLQASQEGWDSCTIQEQLDRPRAKGTFGEVAVAQSTLKELVAGLCPPLCMPRPCCMLCANKSVYMKEHKGAPYWICCYRKAKRRVGTHGDEILRSEGS